MVDESSRGEMSWFRVRCADAVYRWVGYWQLYRGIRGQCIRRGSDLGYIVPNTIPCTRARAYNDSVQDAVLLKTASNRGLTGPQNGPILGS